MHEVAFLPISELSRRIAAKELDPVDLAKVYLERAAGIGRSLNCYVALAQASAAQAAEEAAQRARRNARLGPLDGIPIGIKDNIDVAGVPTSNGFGGSHAAASRDAEVVRRLRAQGAVILGKLNLQEGALGVVNDNPHHGRTHNPFREGYTPGGSSGGSAAAVAAGLCAAALGTDTGGSVRIPAAYCGQVGLKPSYGRVSTRGVVPLSLRLDHVGPLARTVIACTKSMPISRFMAVVTGTITCESTFRKPMFPFFSITPITRNETPLIFTNEPTAGALPKRSSATLCPSTTTFCSALTSSLLKYEPCPGATL